MRTAHPLILVALVAALAVAAFGAPRKAGKMQTLEQPNRSPIVSFRILFRRS